MRTFSWICNCLAVVLAAAAAVSCKQSEPYNPSGEGSVTKYLSTADLTHLFEKSVYDFGPQASSGDPIAITINKNSRYQTIDGFGAAMTGASCYNLLKLSAQARTSFLKEIFDPVDGLGSSLIRVCIGASDFSVDSEFTWCDTPDASGGLKFFEVPYEDKEFLIPVLKEIYKINPDVKIIASPWSAPRWMKNKNSWAGGSLLKDKFDVYAEYFVRWIKTMEGYGFNIHAITIQNESLNAGNSMSMYMSWQDQRDFVKNSLGKAFAEAGLKTKILVYDHNYTEYTYPMNIFADNDAAKYVAGSAWHNYSGQVNLLDNVVKAYPGKEIYFTEASIGDWNHGQPGGFSKCLMDHFESIFMGTMYYNGKGVTLWNLLLDTKNGPHRGQGACTTCYGLATIDVKTGEIVARNSQYYDIAHTSKVIRPGAVRVAIEGKWPGDDAACQAFVNTDGSVAVIILNKSEKNFEFAFKGENTAYALVPAKSIVSLLWQDNADEEK